MLGRPLKIILIDEREAYLRRYHARELSRYEVREIVLSIYGAACACCGETLERVLTVDHVKPLRGKKKRSSLWRRVLNLGCPDTFQILCFNCNQAKGVSAECPHKSLKVA
jgi:5-methylcytosine-specific restriction endonuclease McrA